MYEAIIIEDTKKQELMSRIISWMFILPIIFIIIAFSFISDHLGVALVFLYVFGIIPFIIYEIFFIGYNDRIKIKDGYLYCRSLGLSSKYTFMSYAKLPINKIDFVNFYEHKKFDLDKYSFVFFDSNANKMAEILLNHLTSKTYIIEVINKLSELNIKIDANIYDDSDGNAPLVNMKKTNNRKKIKNIDSISSANEKKPKKSDNDIVSNQDKGKSKKKKSKNNNNIVSSQDQDKDKNKNKNKNKNKKKKTKNNYMIENNEEKEEIKNEKEIELEANKKSETNLIGNYRRIVLNSNNINNEEKKDGK